VILGKRRTPRPVRFATALLGLLACAHGPYPPDRLAPDLRGGAYLRGPAPEPLLVVRIMAIALVDDDGGRATAIDVERVRRWVDFANDVYRRAGIRFDFLPETGGFLHMKNTTLNNLDIGKDWALMERLGNEVSARFRDLIQAA